MGASQYRVRIDRPGLPSAWLHSTGPVTVDQIAAGWAWTRLYEMPCARKDRPAFWWNEQIEGSFEFEDLQTAWDVASWLSTLGPNTFEAKVAAEEVPALVYAPLRRRITNFGPVLFLAILAMGVWHLRHAMRWEIAAPLFAVCWALCGYSAYEACLMLRGMPAIKPHRAKTQV